MPKLVSLAIPQPCSESWAAMSPTLAGRHCAACQQTVVDFTLRTDAEILAFLARAAGGSACGRFAAGQLKRPLQRAAPAAPIRWRAWLAAAVAVWALRETSSAPARGQTPTEMRKMGKVRSVSIERQAQRKSDYEGPVLTLRSVSGTVRDSVTQQSIRGAAIFLRNETLSATTDSAGHFHLRIVAQQPHGKRVLVIHRTGYLSKTISFMQMASPGSSLTVTLCPDPAAGGAEVVGKSRSQERSIVMGMMPLPTMSGAQLPAITGSGRWWQRLFRRN